MTGTAIGAATDLVTEGKRRTPVLLSVNVGMPKNVPWQGKTVYTGVWKDPVDGPAMVRRLNIDGDGQGDTDEKKFASAVKGSPQREKQG